MKIYVTIPLELPVLLLIYFLARLLTQQLLRRLLPAGALPGGWGAAAVGLVRATARPVLVLLLTELALWVAKLHPVSAMQFPHHPDYVRAWFVFWEVILLLYVLEEVTRQIYRARGRTFPIPDLLASILRTLLILAAAFVIMKSILDYDISPLLASTALLTAVLGFALQGVLSNLLAGMSLHITRSVLPGDWVAIGDVEGEVLETNWRETRLRTTNGHIMIIPNSTVSAATIHNMTRPTRLRRHHLDVGASYADAPGDVIDALVKAASSVPRVLADPPPEAYVTAFQDYGINYAVRYWTYGYHERLPLDGDVARMIYYQFKRRGIEIPFPMSDKLLNDFMAVVYEQRRLPPDDQELAQRVVDLKASDFWRRLMLDGEGEPLLSDADLRQMARIVRRLRYTSGETLFHQGDSGESCYVVVSGRLHGRVEYEDTSQAHEFEVGPGALLGEMSLMTGLPRTATISARQEVELLEIPQGAFACLLGLHENIPKLLAELVAERAAKNAAALEKLKAMEQVNVAESIRPENILQRFFRILGCGVSRNAGN
jgi:small-conductance mechanosensitive channel/CRP-like cAMP-binding protein